MTPSRPVGSLAVAPVVAGAAAALLLPGVSRAAAFGALAACAAWAFRGRRGLSLIPAAAVTPAWWLFPLGAFTAVAATMARAETAAGALASIVLMAQALLLLGPPTPWSIRGAIAGSALVAATVVLRFDDRRLLGPVIGYAAALVAGLAALEEGAAGTGGTREAGARRVVAARGRRRWALPLAGLAAVWLLGLPLGFTLSAALPPADAKSDGDERPISRESPTANLPGTRPGHATTPRGGDEPDRNRAGDQFHTGARTSMRLGFVDTVKLDERPALQVRIGEGDESEGALLLRGLSYDEFDGRSWSRSADVEKEVARSEAGRWLTVAPDLSGTALVHLTITDLRGQAAGHLFLRPEPERVRLDALSQGVRLKATADATVYSLSGLDPGAAYVEDARDPRPSEARVAASSSTAGSVPFPRCADAPPDAALFEKIAREAVGTETAPAARAVRIARWLDAHCAYVLAAPELHGAKRPVVDFLSTVRRGSCEYFASSETVLLRTLGHPARLTVGYRGGERMRDGSYGFRGTHAHAWTELWLDDVGWVPIDATPPDRLAADAPQGGEREDDAGTSRWMRAITAVLERVVALLPWGIALTLLLVVATRRRTTTGAWPGGAGGAGPRGPYARVLAALRAAGVARRAPWTPREFEEVAGPTVPPAESALQSLTRDFERERYGGRAPDAALRAKMERDADEVVRAAKSRRRAFRANDGPPGERPPRR